MSRANLRGSFFFSFYGLSNLLLERDSRRQKYGMS